MRRLNVWAFLALVVSFPALAGAPSAPTVNGLLVKFFSDAPTKERDQLHRSLRVKLEKRFPRFSIDFVTPKARRLACDEKALEQLCARYLTHFEVATCRLNRRYRALGGWHLFSKPEPARPPAPDCRPYATVESQRLGDLLKAHGLTPFWDRELCGDDISLERMRAAKLKPASPAIADGGFLLEAMNRGKLPKAILARSKELAGPDNQHGTGIYHLIFGEEYLRGASLMEPFDLFVAALDSQRLSLAQSLLARADRPVAVNFSMATDDNPDVADALEALASRVPLVIAAGNSYPQPLEANLRRMPSPIVVGGLGANGLPNATSQTGARIDIVAPSDEMWQLTTVKPGASWVTSVDANGLTQFGRTSGAAARVTRAIAVATAWLDAKAKAPTLSPESTHLLLSHTAVPLLSSKEAPPENGPGMLNEYLMSRVAERLAAKGWSALDETARQKALSTPLLYDFTTEAGEKLVQGLSDSVNPYCPTQWKGVKEIREAFLLASHPTASARDREIAAKAGAALARVYRAQGLERMAQFYERFDPAVAYPRLVEQMKSPDPNDRITAVRALAQFAERGTPSMRSAYLSLKGKYPSPEALLKQARKDREVGVRQAAVRESIHLPSEDAIRMISESFALDAKLDISDAAVFAALQNPNEFQAQLLQALGTPDAGLQLEAMLAARDPSFSAGDQMIDTALTISSADFRAGLLSLANDLPPDRAFRIFEATLAATQSPAWRNEAVRHFLQNRSLDFESSANLLPLALAPSEKVSSAGDKAAEHQREDYAAAYAAWIATDGKRHGMTQEGLQHFAAIRFPMKEALDDYLDRVQRRAESDRDPRLEREVSELSKRLGEIE